MMTNKPIISIYVALQIFTTQAIPGELILYSDHIKFKASGMVKGNEVKDTFLLSEINKIQLQRGIILHKLVIIDNENDVWRFKQINKSDAQHFITQYKKLTTN
ncbi:hypothetical protein NQ035_00230 [Staphylococcus gallinarum]|jgi:hypothetical protein|uniref:GRAM domain-containing protein n=2 Tax=Staphylococcus gallinarum TaxID=1293 RepID=A0A2T4SXQ0_STAGA|nr:hypothetical protein [Staphylococcus gallinarum]MCD8819794.1 hypothetical protein [Staphylococcus gallinarum]MCD8826224.1 hypothetical protein [Staphylococcus gallinarum]MCQ9287288.1 hypothetical protein [Staphylococcus gallinarum]PTL10123.1 hypothetical protein BUZ15_05115 [Staphylococcus gallinarum]RIL27323.1 hypothetical protein BUY98_14510 [Staphylococcus gallinarum]